MIVGYYFFPTVKCGSHKSFGIVHNFADKILHDISEGHKTDALKA